MIKEIRICIVKYNIGGCPRVTIQNILNRIFHGRYIILGLAI